MMVWATVTVQAQDFRTETNDRGNRFEGYAEKQISSRFRLVGVLGYRLRAYEPGDVLQVSFPMPTTSQEALVNAYCLGGCRGLYRMEAKQTSWDRGWQTFGPWQVDAVLTPENITARQIAVLVQDEKEVLLPAYLHTGTRPMDAPGRYRVYFFTPERIERLEHELIHIETGTTYEGDALESEDPQSYFYMNVRLPDDAPEGPYELVVTITWEDGTQQKKEYTLLHQKP